MNPHNRLRLHLSPRPCCRLSRGRSPPPDGLLDSRLGPRPGSRLGSRLRRRLDGSLYGRLGGRFVGRVGRRRGGHLGGGGAGAAGVLREPWSINDAVCEPTGVGAFVGPEHWIAPGVSGLGRAWKPTPDALGAGGRQETTPGRVGISGISPADGDRREHEKVCFCPWVIQVS